MACGQECVCIFISVNVTHLASIGNPDIPPVLIGKIRIGQELRVKCYAKKVRLFDLSFRMYTQNGGNSGYSQRTC